MTSTWRTAAIIGAFGVLAMAPGIAFAHGHQGDRKSPEKVHQVIHGTLAMTSLAAIVSNAPITISTAGGKLVTVDLTSRTHLSLEANGTDGQLMGGKATVYVTAVVVSQNGTLTAQEVNAHVSAVEKSKRDQNPGKHDRHQNHEQQHHH